MSGDLTRLCLFMNDPCFLGRQASEDADENGESENQLNNKDVELSTGNDHRYLIEVDCF